MLIVKSAQGPTVLRTLLVSQAAAQEVARVFVDECRSFYFEPYPDGQACIKCDVEHEAAALAIAVQYAPAAAASTTLNRRIK